MRQEVLDFLRQRGLRPRKGLGQNFLMDENALAVILRATEPTSEDTIVEVGPGPGILTMRLARAAGRVVAVEVDRAFAEGLEKRAEGHVNLEIVNQDVLQTSPGELVAHRPYKVVGNLPYSIAAAVLRHFLEADHRPERLVVTVQKEVAESICARPGDLGLLGVSIQVYGEPRIVRVLPPWSFYPQPKVHSAIVRIEVYPEPRVPRDLRDSFFATVRAGFAAPRKQVHNSLALGLRIDSAQATACLQAADILPSRRPQTLSVEEWLHLAEAVTHEHDPAPSSR